MPNGILLRAKMARCNEITAGGARAYKSGRGAVVVDEFRSKCVQNLLSHRFFNYLLERSSCAGCIVPPLFFELLTMLRGSLLLLLLCLAALLAGAFSKPRPFRSANAPPGTKVFSLSS